jgi:hypothetical protein
MNAMKGVEDKLEFRGRKADVHYSLPKEGDQEKNQASLDVVYSESSERVSDHALQDYMTKFGEVRSVKPNPFSPK